MNVKKERKKILLLIMLSIPMCIIFANNTGTVDHMEYAYWYEMTALNGKSDRFEIGYTLCMILATKLGLSMACFLMIYSGIGLFLIAKSFFDYCKFPVWGFVMYAIYPFLMDAEQLRNFMSVAIIMYGLRYLKKYSKKNVIKYIVFVLLASSFHIASLVCLIYMLSYLRDYKKILIISTILSIFIIIGYFSSLAIFRWLLTLLSAGEYISKESFLFKVLGWGSFAILTNFIIFLYYNLNGKSKQKDDNWIKYIMPCSILMCSFIIVSSQTYRFFRNMIPLIYIVLLNIGIEREGTKVRISIIKGMITAVVLIICVFFWQHQLAPGGTHYEYIVKPIFKNTLVEKRIK